MAIKITVIEKLIIFFFIGYVNGAARFFGHDIEGEGTGR